MKIQLALTQLNPLRQHIVLFIDLIGQFSDVIQTFLRVGGINSSETADLMTDTVYERQNTHNHRYLGTLVEMATLGFLNTQPAHLKVFGFLLQKIDQLMIVLAATIEIVEQPQQEHQQHNGPDNGNEHPVELFGSDVVLCGTGL